MNISTAISIYQDAIDPAVGAAEGEAWWSTVALELDAVVRAPSAAAAARVIAWWHQDWSLIADSPTNAAKRIRKAASRHRCA